MLILGTFGTKNKYHIWVWEFIEVEGFLVEKRRH